MAKKQTAEASLIYDVADGWRDTCLMRDGSLFTPDRSVWRPVGARRARQELRASS